MKKIYLVILSVSILSAATSFAQNRAANSTPMNISSSLMTPKNNASVQPMNMIDTLTNHWDPIYPVPSVDTAVTYRTSAGPCVGYVVGQNKYDDIAKAQKFDAAYGVTSSNGSITNMLMWVGQKCQSAGAATWIPTIWADNAGVPGTVLGTAAPVTVALMDTALASLQYIGPFTALEGAYNVNAAFTPAVAIPVNQIFWAGFTITYAAGDSAGLVSSRDGAYTTPGNGNFTDAVTHTFSQWNDNSWHDMVSDWGLEVALAVYPIVDFVTAVNEYPSNGSLTLLGAYPNPASDFTNIKYSISEASVVSVEVFDLTGRVIHHSSEKLSAGTHDVKISLKDIPSGNYYYTIKTETSTLTSKFVAAK